MVKISKEDAKTLNKEYGIPYGSYGISHTDSCSHKRKTYYLCTSFKNMKAYNAIRAKDTKSKNRHKYLLQDHLILICKYRKELFLNQEIQMI